MTALAPDYLDCLKRFCLELAEVSREVILPYFGASDLQVEEKADASPVTVADRRAEVAMRARIARAYPTHGVIGEEFGPDREHEEFVWVLDPIDGTISFTHGVPLFGTLVGLLHQGRPLLGMIHQPVLNKTCLGDNDSCLANGKPARIRSTSRLSDATLLWTCSNWIEREQNGAGFDRLRRAVRVARTWGDCFGYLLLCEGRADIMLDPLMKPWDLLPLIPVLRGAGLAVTDWHGGDVERGQSCVAAVPAIHPEVLKLLSQQVV